jgi:UDP-N-acetylmuramate: L-alanyl-gamma-D-glutamyl-meso-diaminopimelate ligase
MIDFYFLGIGGTAMANVAVALSTCGYNISGVDANVYPPMSEFLERNGIVYFNGYSAEHLETLTPKYVVVGNAISRGNAELEVALNRRLKLVSMPEIVREYLIEQHTSIVVSGTHGKTTTTSLLAWLLESCGVSPGFLIGGIPENFGEGCRASTRKTNGYFVSEGDEYDTAFFDKRSKFLHYRPDIAIVNNLEFDHADIFSSISEIELSFKRFLNLVPQKGLALLNADDARVLRLSEKLFAPVQTFGFGENATWQARDVDYRSDETHFSLFKQGNFISRFRSPLLGEHNVRNALAAVSACLYLGFQPDVIQSGLSSFKSVKRRLEVVAEIGGITLIDDFAHHPTAIRETLKATRQKYPNRRIVACFEPRSNTTTRNIFQKELVECFEFADVIALGKIDRPERYAPDERLDTEKIISELKSQGKIGYASPMPIPENYPMDIVNFLSSHLHHGDVILAMSNGAFGNLKAHLLETLKNSLSDVHS